MRSAYLIVLAPYILGLPAFGGYIVLNPSLLPWKTTRSFRSQIPFNTVVIYQNHSNYKELPEIKGSGSLPSTCTPQYILRTVKLSQR